MTGIAEKGTQSETAYGGLRMTADEFLGIVDEGRNYELIDGVVTMTPSTSPKHQQVWRPRPHCRSDLPRVAAL